VTSQFSPDGGGAAQLVLGNATAGHCAVVERWCDGAGGQLIASTAAATLVWI
jgi:hypothetical protein